MHEETIFKANSIEADSESNSDDTKGAVSIPLLPISALILNGAHDDACEYDEINSSEVYCPLT